MTERLYYSDPSCRTFDAVVTRSVEHEGRPAAVLDRTAFYPASGGQPFDTGRLGSADVVEAIEIDGDIVHVLGSPLTPGAAVRGEVDWPRRFDHMQQHTGQHVLSAAFERLFDNPTVGFHLGAEISTIDLVHQPTPAEIERAVDEANRVVWENRPVSIRFVSDTEARTLPLRKEPAREGTLRLVEVLDFDLSACGGTHVARTGAIGMIAVTAAERLRGGGRVAFVCGGRALRVTRMLRDAVAGTTRLLSVLPAELPSAVERLQIESRELRKTAGRLQERLAGHDAERLLAGAERRGGVQLIVHVASGLDASGIKAMASALIAREHTGVVLVSDVAPVSVVVARSAGLSVDASGILRALLSTFGGRGGGRSDLAQGGGLSGAPDEIAAAARQLLTAAAAEK